MAGGVCGCINQVNKSSGEWQSVEEAKSVDGLHTTHPPSKLTRLGLLIDANLSTLSFECGPSEHAWGYPRNMTVLASYVVGSVSESSHSQFSFPMHRVFCAPPCALYALLWYTR